MDKPCAQQAFDEVDDPVSPARTMVAASGGSAGYFLHTYWARIWTLCKHGVIIDA